jgi:hypothetical protein
MELTQVAVCVRGAEWNSAIRQIGNLRYDSGTTWATKLAPIVAWQPVAMPGDGSRIIAGTVYGSIYISQTVQAAALPWLSLNLSGNQAFVTWPTNAAGFTLQQNTNLLTTNWLKVTNLP